MPEQDINQLSQRLRRIRIQRGLTQSAVAQRIGVNKSTVTRWESGKGTTHLNRAVISALADLFDVSPSYLTGRVNEPLIREVNEVQRVLDDTQKLLRRIFEGQLTSRDPLLNRKILAQVTDINQTCLDTPSIYEHIDKKEAHIALKYLLVFYGIPCQDYGEGLLQKLISSQLLPTFLHNSLSLMQQVSAPQ